MSHIRKPISLFHITVCIWQKTALPRRMMHKLSRFSSCVFQVKYVIKEDLLYKHTCLFPSPSETVLQWQWRKKKEGINLQRQRKRKGRFRRKQEPVFWKLENSRRSGQGLGRPKRAGTWGSHEERSGRGWFHLSTLPQEWDATSNSKSQERWGREKGGFVEILYFKSPGPLPHPGKNPSSNPRKRQGPSLVTPPRETLHSGTPVCKARMQLINQN